jgi:hypothetical protein
MKINWASSLMIMMSIAGMAAHTRATDSRVEKPIRQLLDVGADAAGILAAQKAVDELVAGGTKSLLAILSAIPADDVVKANWLRTAFNRIVEDAIRSKSPMPTEELLAFVSDKTKSGRSRRLALETVEKVIPGTSENLIDAGLNDPEFGADAVAARMLRAASADANGDKLSAIKLYREAFAAAQDFAQCITLAQRLKALDVVVDPLAQLGVVRDWLVVGPFDDRDEKGFATIFPPEKAFNPNSSYDGKNGKVAWKRFTSEATDGRIDLIKAVAPSDGAVAYAYIRLTSPKEQDLELRAGGDDNLAVWVNGLKVIDHPTYRSHLRIDWHRAKARFKTGENTILVKVCQCVAPKEKAPGPPAKWEFHLRLVDADGRGISLPVVVPSSKR